MKLLPLKCNQCNRIIYRSIQRINEANKFSWKTYCSKQCQNKAKDKQKIIKCSNPNCNKIFKRQLNDIQPIEKNYCSRSCSASVNNTKFPKRKAIIRSCLVCSKKFKGKEKFCSANCKNKSQIISGNKILEEIRIFFDKNRRIPIKKEFTYARTARVRFGSWNNAISKAGYEPNPVRFAKKHIAKDGHKCDSLAEKIIDDWLYSRKITHERNYQYGVNRMTADFKVKDFLIEFLGLKGQLKSYDRLIGIKKKLWKKRKLKVIEIYPEDLFPNNRLDKILKIFINNN